MNSCWTKLHDLFLNQARPFLLTNLHVLLPNESTCILSCFTMIHTSLVNTRTCKLHRQEHMGQFDTRPWIPRNQIRQTSQRTHTYVWFVRQDRMYIYVYMAESLWHSLGKCSCSMQNKVGSNYHVCFVSYKMCMQCYLSFLSTFACIQMAESPWHSIGKCPWSMQSKVWIYYYILCETCVCKTLSPFSLHLHVSII